jgi:hypothetical protein
MITLIHGLIIYPYYDSAKLMGADRLFFLRDFFELKFINCLYLALHSMKNLVKETLTTFVVSLWVYHLYSANFELGFCKIRKYVFMLATILGIYAIPEVLLFKFNFKYSYDILQILNPFLYDVKSYMGWYPPVVWPNEQLRSYCIEPSVFGYMAGLIIPFLWTSFIENGSLLKNVFYTYFIMLLFMTKSRTANLIFLVDMALLPLFFYSTKIKKVIVLIISLSILGFILNLNFFSYRSFNISVKRDINNNVAEEYYRNNIKTIADKKARSNGSRLINIKSHLNVIMQHPILGTGTGLKDLYVEDNLVPRALENPEIKGITKGINEKGIDKFTYGNVNHFIYVATNDGIPGLIIYILPIFYIIIITYRNKSFLNMHRMVLLLSLLGLLSSSVTGEITLAMYIVLGLLYIDTKQDKNVIMDMKSIDNVRIIE